jgi:hypothetical protein
MFVQIIEGRTTDAEGMKRQGEAWQTDLRPGATGYLGVTAGTSADGRTIAIVRFESEEAARANSERPEQGAWFEEMRKYFDGEPSFRESSDVSELLGGGSDAAGFVQVMKVHGTDRAEVERMDKAFEKFAHLRPDLLGIVRAWTGPDTYVEAAYFTSETEARAAERTEMPAELQEQLAGFEALMANTEWLDLSDPQLH